MRLKYRIIYTALFDSPEERDRGYIAARELLMSEAMTKAAVIEVANITKDETFVQDPPVTERLV